jgi:hypothetical protein
MNSKLNHIKPAFAPETEFQIEALTILPGDKTPEDSAPSRSFDLSAESEFVSWPRNPFSALND